MSHLVWLRSAFALIQILANTLVVPALSQVPDSSPSQRQVAAQRSAPQRQGTTLEALLQMRNQALELTKQGRYDEAILLVQRALSLAEKDLGPNDPSVAALASQLGVLYANKGDYVHAEQQYRRELTITEKTVGVNDPEYAVALNNLAALYQQEGDHARAESMMRQALTIKQKVLKPDDDSILDSLNNLAVITRDAEEAERLLQSILEIQIKRFGADGLDVALTLDNLATRYLDKKDYARAEPLARHALAINEKALGPDNPACELSLFNLAMIEEGKGNWTEAESLWKRALGIHQSIGMNHPYAATVLYRLALLEHKRGNTAQALVYLKRATEVSERNISLVLTTGSEIRKRLYLESLAGETNAAIALNASSDPPSPESSRLALTVVLQRKGRALDAMIDLTGTLRQRFSPEDRALFDELSAARSRLASLVLNKPNTLDPAQYQSSMKKVEAAVDQLETQLSSTSAEFHAATRPVTLDRVQQDIPTEGALVEFVRYRPFNVTADKSLNWGPVDADRYAAYVMGHGGEPAVVDLGKAALIDIGVHQLRKAISDADRVGTNLVEVKKKARALDELIMRPVRKLLGDKRTLLLSPDSDLNLVPFSALVDERNQYLVENYSINYLTSGRDVLRLETRVQSRQGPVVVANPRFDVAIAGGADRLRPATSTGHQDFFYLEFDPLKGSAREAQVVTGILTGAKLLTGIEATEANVKKLTGPRILHLATHGFFLPDESPKQADKLNEKATTGRAATQAAQTEFVRRENPLLRSGLALAGANKKQSGLEEDGILTALEVCGLDLWGTRLVVLSACETGLGDVKNGEGVYGLRRALLIAGAETEVISLWEIADEETGALMSEYYRRLLAGEGRMEALRQAQLTLLRRKATSHPFFWATFIPVGEWRGLEQKD